MFVIEESEVKGKDINEVKVRALAVKMIFPTVLWKRFVYVER